MENFGAPAIGIISFGSWFGPHVAFAGAVAGAAFAMTRNHIENGQDIVTPLVKFGDPMVLIVGGIFGMVGFLIQYIVGPLVGPILLMVFWEKALPAGPTLLLSP